MNALDLDILGIQTLFHISLLGHLYSLRTFGGKSKQSEHVSYGAPPVQNFYRLIVTLNKKLTLYQISVDLYLFSAFHDVDLRANSKITCTVR